MSTAEKPKTDASPLARLEEAMRAQKLDLLLQGVADEFQGEYTPQGARRLTFLTGFTGSAGLGVFRAGGKHALFVDGRYTLQAANEVDPGAIQIVNSGDVSFGEWLRALSSTWKGEDQGGGRQRSDKQTPAKPHPQRTPTQPSPLQGEGLTPRGPVIGFDPWLVTEQQLAGWKKAAPDAEWQAVTPNLADSIWDDRAAPPAGDVHLLAKEFTGESYDDKRRRLLAAMEKEGANALILTQPDGINWLLNIRGADIPYNPLLLGYLLLSAKETVLYVYERSFSKEILSYFEKLGVKLGKLEDVFDGSAPGLPEGSKILLDPSLAGHGWWQLAQTKGWEIISGDDPTLLPKACKNEAELVAIRSAHARDGLALTRFLCWFDKRAAGGNLPDELEIAGKLEEFRARDEGYRGASFATIAGTGPHGAIVHYHATGKSNRRAVVGELLLLDSGGQYDGGTTDVTRTVFASAPSKVRSAPGREVREHVTRVLKGHIALASACFPEGTSGIQLDALARQYLWAAGLDYDHGTGHGVGAGLCVHEGPQRISKKGSTVPLQPGMIVSNEPGYYKEGAYGIRIESLVVVAKAGTTSDGKAKLCFETLTLVPIDTRLVDVTMLNNDERNWLNDYHRRVHKAHAPHLDDAERQWLADATRAV